MRHAKPAGPRSRPGRAGLRFAGVGLLLILPLGMLASLLPRSEADSQPIAAMHRDTFAARWPSKDAVLRNVSAQSDIRPSRPQPQATAASAISDAINPSLAATGQLTAGAIGNNPAWKAYALAAPSPPQQDGAVRFQTALNRQSDKQFKSQPLQAQPLLPDNAPLGHAKTELVKFGTAPFPFDGVQPGTDRPFLNVVNGDQKGHRSSRGSVLWKNETYNDSRVLLHIPSGFDINKPAVMVVFFHGHGAELERDVLNRQKLPEQISLSGMNAVLVAPQFAVNAADSSPGRFWLAGGFARFIDEAGKKLADIYGKPAKVKQFGNMPVILVAYSGGYLPASYSIRKGGIGPRLRGVVLLDALYGESGNFVQWIKKSPSVFFISAYTSSTKRQNMELARVLDDENIPYGTEIGRHLWRGRVALLETSSQVNHRDFVTRAWTGNPIADILAKLN